MDEENKVTNVMRSKPGTARRFNPMHYNQNTHRRFMNAGWMRSPRQLGSLHFLGTGGQPLQLLESTENQNSTDTTQPSQTGKQNLPGLEQVSTNSAIIAKFHYFSYDNMLPVGVD